MANKLFVGGLSWNTTDEGLQQAFERFGRVLEAKVMLDCQTGHSRGYGFVTFAEDGSATVAIAKMDGTSLDGRAIRVSEAEHQGRPAGRADRSVGH
jgi:heterogeneous nuclear ribonucleoprotein G